MKEKTKKPLFKRVWFWILVVIVLFIVIGSMGSSKDIEESETPEATQAVEATAISEAAEEAASEAAPVAAEKEVNAAAVAEEPAQQETADSSVSWEYLNALAQAQTYSDSMHMSKQGIFDQLTSDYGEKFTAEEAQYAVDNLG